MKAKRTTVVAGVNERYVQKRHPLTKWYSKIDLTTGRVVAARETPYKGIRIIERSEDIATEDDE